MAENKDPLSLIVDTDLVKIMDTVLPPGWREEFEKKVWSSCVQEGRSIRAMGFPIDTAQIQLMRDPDMKVSMQMGWRMEDEERRPAEQRDPPPRKTKPKKK
jgi:hypothetical protein